MNRILIVVGSLLSISCDKREGGASPGAVGEQESSRVETRGRYREEVSDPRLELRESYQAALSESDPVAREKALEAVAWDGIDIDPELSREAFAALPPGGEGARRLVGHFAMRLADRDPEDALEWARGLDDQDERSDAIGRIAVVVSVADPPRAASLLMDEMAEGPARDRAVVQVVRRWVVLSSGEAADWIVGLPGAAARGAGIRTVTAGWLESDPEGLNAWISSRERPLGDEILFGMATHLSALDESDRRAKLATLPDGDVRERLENLLAQTLK